MDEFRLHLENGLVQEVLTKIAEKFASPEHVGPKHVADFDDIADPEERARLQRDAFERVNAFITRLKVLKRLSEAG